MRRGSLNSRWMAASGCLVAALALGVAACGSDEPSSGGSSSGSGGGGGKTLDDLLVPAAAGRFARRRPRRSSTAPSSRSSRPAARPATSPIKYMSLDDSTAQAGKWTPEATSANARKAAQDDNDRRLHRRVQLGRLRGLDPDPQRGGRPADLPGQHRRRPHHRRAGRRARASRTSTTRRGERTYARIVPKDTIQGAALATLMKQDGCTKVAMTNDKEVYGAGLAANIELAAKAQGLNDHLQRGDRQERGELPLAGLEGQGRRR